MSDRERKLSLDEMENRSIRFYEHQMAFHDNWMIASWDEAHRMRPSPEKWAVHYRPLIELGMRRSDCYEWLKSHGYHDVPKSSVRKTPTFRTAT